MDKAYEDYLDFYAKGAIVPDCEYLNIRLGEAAALASHHVRQNMPPITYSLFVEVMKKMIGGKDEE